jgi:hypothetical protein
LVQILNDFLEENKDGRSLANHFPNGQRQSRTFKKTMSSPTDFVANFVE